MTDIFVDRSEDYEGDENSPSTATGSIIVTMTGTLGSAKRKPVLTVYARTGSAAFVLAHQQPHFGRHVVPMAPGDEYYVNVTSIEEDAVVTLAIADMQ